MIIFAVDPGCEYSAWCVYDSSSKKIFDQAKEDNFRLLRSIREYHTPADVMVIEMIKSYGNVMGDSVIETCVWIGRFIDAWAVRTKAEAKLIPRKSVVTQICNNPRAKDSNVRQALIDRFGRGSEKKGGVLQHVKNDMWSALAVAVAWDELQKQNSDALERALR